jgi:hypothetical protein
MRKEQQRGNKEAKKPRKTPVPAAIPVAGATLTPAQKAGLPRWPKK